MVRRPTDVNDVRSRLADFHTDAGTAAWQALRVRPDDVFVATYSKSGTTWMQQVVHQLRSGGDTDFEEIMEVVPFLEVALDAGVDPRADQSWAPRAFKCHLTWRDVPKGGRYITVFRDPRSVVTSFHRFFEGWWFEPGSITLDEFAAGLYLDGTASGRHWDHLVDWWPRVGDTDVLALAYEDMVVAPDAVPAVVAGFLDIDLDQETMGTVVRHCSREWMHAHATKFDEHLWRERRDADLGLPPGGDASKAHSTGHTIQRSPWLEQSLTRAWEETVTPALGFADYDEFRAALPDPLGVRSQTQASSRSISPP